MRITKEDNNREIIHSKKIISGVVWNTIETFIINFFNFIIKLVLARILSPEHFGLIGMATVFTSLIHTINELGLGAALIQKKESELKEIHYDVVFWVTTLFNFITFIIVIFAIAPFVSWFYKEPILRSIVIILTIPILLKPLTLIHRIVLTRKMDFKSNALIESISTVVSGVIAVIMAVCGMGIWSIVFQGIIASLIAVPLSWKMVYYFPRWRFSKEAFSDIFGFGIFVLLNQVIDHFVKNVDYLLIGKLLGSDLLGVYTLAFMLTDTFRMKFMAILNKVMYPLYSKIQSDKDLVGAYYLKIIKYNTLFIFPIMILFFLYAEPIIMFFFGGKWKEAIIPFKLLSIAIMFHASIGSASTVLKGIGKAKLDFILYLIKSFIVTIPAIVIGIKVRQINGASVGVLISKIVSWLVVIVGTRRVINVSFMQIIKSMLPALSGCLMLFVLSWSLNLIWKPSNVLELIILITMLGLIYFGISLYFNRKTIMKILKEYKFLKLKN